MGYGIVETTNYLLFTNPVSEGVFTGLSAVARGLGITPKGSSDKQMASAPIKAATKYPLYDLAGHNLLFIRIAGVSGASAIAINAYFTHYHRSNPHKDKELKKIFEKTNQFHLIHSLALLAVPLVRRPWLTGSMMITSMVLFCGSGYYHAITGNSKYRNVAVIGNCFLFVSWWTMLF
ncbi:transmembrane protein 256 homolog [Bradysia coprophila]|uniref:transmembrane protein 256 homolog n=1 Tax=Bradysia coprophila TaxID=38358 RepID=UPI00187D8A90|nr:transmembrane protein 256 homolog [Bradysia coprophila]